MEQWRPVAGWEGLYKVSDHGRVRSVDREVAFGSRTRFVRGRILKGGRTIQGRLFVILSGDGRRLNRSIHQLVLEAFVGPRPAGMECCHFNDECTDNRLVNLRWDTHRANEIEKVRNGKHHQAIKTHCPRGHEYTSENTKTHRGGRFCRQCHREDGRARYHRDIENQRAYKRERQRRRRALAAQKGG